MRDEITVMTNALLLNMVPQPATLGSVQSAEVEPAF